MSTAVLDIDFADLPKEINGLSAYSRALILLRYKGKPIGKKIVDVSNGKIVIEEFYDKLVNATSLNLLQCRLNEYLNYDPNKRSEDYVLPKASIAICTRERPDDLKRCLDALMKLPDDGQEILVIDNCPVTSATKELAQSMAYKNVRYILESRKGLNIARNRALAEARNEIVAFTDDDATPDSNWLRSILRNFDSPLVLCVTGLTLPLELETDGQEAFEKYSPFGKGFNRIVHSSSTRNPLSTGEVGAGANMALKKAVLDKIGIFDEALDAGTLTQSGGDHEYFARILLAGYKIVYEPDALSWHRHRRKMEETRKAIKGYGIGVYAFWTRLFVEEKELSIIKFPWHWFMHTQLPNVWKAVFRLPGSKPLALVLAELQGCLIGPWAYISARKKIKRMKI